MSDDELLAEQRDLYRRRAGEYDEWWQRQGRYDHGPEEAAMWQAEVDRVDESLTVVDASPETLALNRERIQRADVRHLVADIFALPLRAQFDVVFFSFWLSHVPRARVPAFWSSVASLLASGGRVFLIDNRLDPSRPKPDRLGTSRRQSLL